MVHASRSHRHALVALVHTMLYRDIPCRVSTLSQDCVYACMYACISVGRSLCPGCTSRLSLFLSSFQDFVSCAGRTRKCNIEVCRHIHPSPPCFSLSLSLAPSISTGCRYGCNTAASRAAGVVALVVNSESVFCSEQTLCRCTCELFFIYDNE